MQHFKMKFCWVIWLTIGQFRQYLCFNELHYFLYDLSYYSSIVIQHYPGRFTTTMTTYINGTEEQIPSDYDTPDYRIEEPHFVPQSYKYVELERPYRNSPAYKNYLYYGNRGYSNQAELMYAMGCYCNTVYRKFTLLAGCAVITTRHIVTTATPTMLILRSYSHKRTMTGILGMWYDIDTNRFNSSMYEEPSRIHVHPDYTYEHEVNVTHPIPAMYDLAIMSTMRRFFAAFPFTYPFLCARAGSGTFEYTSTIPRWDDLSIVAGFQFIKSYDRLPMPWFSDWQWYHCIMGEYWGKFGFDSGGGMNTGYNERWRYDGLAGMCAFSLKLRSKQTVHYFTVLDNYPVLDFMYDAFLGLKPPVFMDSRFENTKWAAPVPYYGESIPAFYDYGHEYYTSEYYIPYY